uniref:Fungal lipase-like domain-containing protein n=1 Tax=Arundo donax TaxID=35708 RepID=A0A0A9EQG7_ARUDO
MAMAAHGSMSCSTTWRELTNTSWRDDDYRRMVMACLIEAVYLLELERQERRDAAAVAQQWWKPFQYRLADELVDKRDGSVFGAVFERENHHPHDGDGEQPSGAGAPRAVIAFRGTLLRAPTIRRDVEDELRLLARNSLRGSVRLASALQALRATIDRFGPENVCVCGHSLGAGFARQVGRMLMASPRRQPQPQQAAAAAALEFHLFNAPYLSLPMGVRSVVKTADCLLKALRSGVATVGRWHGKALRNVAYANCILGYTRLESSRRL